MTDKKKAAKKTGLELLREPFEAHQIGKLPKPTAAQTKEVKANWQSGIRCAECGQWHHPKAVHLDYVGHAALTDRMLDADPKWDWQPLAKTERGLPLIVNGELWIKLTICGMTRLGVGDAQGKSGTNATKEMIGDALRNAGMRFGMALDLWHKGDLHADDDDSAPEANQAPAHGANQWNGPLDVQALKGKAQDMATDLKKLKEDGKESDLVVFFDKDGYAAIFDQLEKDLPDYHVRIKELIAATRAECKERDTVFPGDLP